MKIWNSACSNNQWILCFSLFARFSHYLPIILLVIAAAAKIQSFVTVHWFGGLSWQQLVVGVTFPVAEFGVACWLWSEVLQKQSRHASMVLFVIFSFVSFAKFIDQQETCGCFGDISIAPSVSFALDMAALSCLFFWSPARVKPRGAMALFVFLLFSVMSTGVVAVSHSRYSGLEGVGRGSVVVLEPEKWITTKFPFDILLGISNEPDLLEGRWDVVFYVDNCEHCKVIVERFLSNNFPVVFVELPLTIRPGPHFVKSCAPIRQPMLPCSSHHRIRPVPDLTHRDTNLPVWPSEYFVLL